MSAVDRNAAPIGHLADLPADEADLIVTLRQWCDGPSGQAAVWNSFATRLGPEKGRRALRAFEDLVTLFDTHSRRQLMRNEVCCRCVGADECVFARFVSQAAAGAREDAMLMAMLIVRPDMAPGLTALAEQVGLILRQGLCRTLAQDGEDGSPPGPKRRSRPGARRRAARRGQTTKPPTMH